MTRPVEQRLFGNIEPIPWSGCWIWMGCVDKKGYGDIERHGKKAKAHRVAWELANGRAVPDGLLVCHSCDIPSCVNPSHLWLGTNQQNLADAGRKGRLSINHHHGIKTHCPHGHPYDELNTLRYPSGGRKCATCQRSRDRRKLSEPETVERGEKVSA